MRLPVELLWRVGGDLYRKVFKGEDRRPIEAFWQSLKDLAADGLRYVEHVKSTRNIFEVEPFAPYGTFPVDPTKVRSPEYLQGILVGGRKEGAFFWYAYFNQTPEFAKKGVIQSDAQTVKYDQFSFRNLASGGTIGRFGMPSVKRGRALRDRWGLEQGAGASFGFGLSSKRWDTQGSLKPTFGPNGVHYEVTGVQWGILSDTYYMSGNDRWRQVWVIDIENWPKNDGQRAVTVSSFDDRNNKYMARIYEDNNGEVHVGFGQSAGQGMQMTIGSKESTSGWAKTLKQASGSVQLEIVIEHAPSNPAMIGEVWLDGKKATQAQVFTSIAPGRRTQTFDVVNEADTLKLNLAQLAVPRGKLWGRAPNRSLEMSFQSSGHVYDVGNDLVASKQGVRLTPWKLEPKADVKDYTSPTLKVELKDGWSGYTPEWIRFDSGQDRTIFEKESQNGREVTYTESINQGMPPDLSGQVSLTPWYLRPGEIEWVDDERIKTNHPIPNANRIWLLGTRGREVDLYNRYGKVLGIPERPDSADYLATLRGMQYGLLTEATPHDMERAVNMTLRVPYVQKSGVIKNIELVDHPKTGQQSIKVSLTDETVYVDPSFEADLKVPGERIEAFDPLVRGAESQDWRSHPDTLDDLVGRPEKWGTFLVALFDHQGINQTVAQDIRRLLRETKNRHHDYKVYQVSDQDEDPKPSDRMSPGGLVSTREDSVFSDGGTVVNHRPVNPETQTQNTETLSGEHLSSFSALGGKRTVRPSPTWVELGVARGKPYHSYMGLLDPAFDDLKRPLEPNEQSAGFQRATLRTSSTKHYDGSTSSAGYPRAYSLQWVYDAKTGGSLTSGRTIDAELAYTASAPIQDVAFKGPIDIQMIAGGDVITSSDYGYSFQSTNLTASTLRIMHQNWVGGDDGALFREDNGWSQVSNPAGSGDHILGIDQKGGTVYIAVHDASNNDTYVYTSDDQGATWSTLGVGPIDTYNDVHDLVVEDSGSLLLGAPTGLYRISTNGNPNRIKADRAFEVRLFKDGIRFLSANGTIFESTDGGSTWSSISLPTSKDLVDISSYTPYRHVVVDKDSTVLWSISGLSGWESTSVNSRSMELARCAQHGGWSRLATDAEDLYRWI